MNIRDKYIPWILGAALTTAVGATLLFKWNNDGPGTHGGGEDLNRKIAAPMADAQEQHARTQRQGQRATVEGTVRDGAGAPLADATVCAAARSTLLGASDTQWPRCATTGADGRYRIDDLFGVQQRVGAAAPGYLPADHVRTTTAGVRQRTLDLRPGGAARDVDVALVRGGVALHGVVLDPYGVPIADARVASGGPGSGSGIVWTRSDAEGRFALWVRPGTVTVTAQATGRALASATGPTGDRPFTLYLAPAAVLHGQVRRADDHTPVEGAWVRASLDGGAVRTDTDGRFSFDALPPGVYKPWVEADDGFGMAKEQVSLGLGETSRPLAIALRPAVFVDGRVVHAPGGAGCEDGVLSLREASSGRELRDATEPDGQVHLRGVLPGTYAVRVTCNGSLADDRRAPLIVGDGDVRDQVWNVEDRRTLAGVVVDADGAAVAGVTLAARPVDGSQRPTEVVSDAEGRFVVRGLVAGTAVQFVPVGHAQRTMPDAPVTRTIADADANDLEIVLAATGEARVTLRDPEGRPIAGAELGLRTARGEQHARTDSDGRVAFTRAAVGDSVVVASLGGASLPLREHPPARVRVGARVALDLVSARPPGAISGLLRDAEGQPLAGAFVTAQADGVAVTRGPWNPDGARPQWTDADGRFTIAGLAPATYAVTALRLGGGQARHEHAAVGEALTLTIAPPARIGGTVVAPGSAVPDVFTVDLVDATTGRRRGDTFIATAGAWGFAGVEPGRLEVHVRAREGAAVHAVTLAAGQHSTDVRVALIGATTLRGAVVDLAGAPVAGLEVGVGGLADRAVTDAAGRFELPRVTVGSLVVTVGPAGGQASPYATSRVAVDVPADTAVLDLPAIRVATRRIAVGGARGDLGFTMQSTRADGDPRLADLKVLSVRPGGPADAAGLRPLDEIVSVDEQDVRGANRSLYTTLTEVPAGTVVRLGLARGVTLAIATTRRR